MIGFVIAAHGQLGHELLKSAQRVLGPIESCVCIDSTAYPHEAQLRGDFERAVAEVDSGDGVLILTDLFGGTPANLGLAMMTPGKVEVLTGVNLPMLLKLASLRKQEQTLGVNEMAEHAMNYGQRNISLASRLLQ